MEVRTDNAGWTEIDYDLKFVAITVRIARGNYRYVEKNFVEILRDYSSHTS